MGTRRNFLKAMCVSPVLATKSKAVEPPQNKQATSIQFLGNGEYLLRYDDDSCEVSDNLTRADGTTPL